MGLPDRLQREIDEATVIPPPDHDLDATDELPPFDLADFDPDDEQAFFNACLIMDTEGQFGGHELSRAAVMRRFEIVDRNHWHTVKESMYAVLILRHGSMDAVGQREISWRMGHLSRRASLP